MPEGMFHTIALSAITIPADRQRKDIPPNHIPDLAKSIQALDLINPITLDRDNILIAGWCRYHAVYSLGWTHVACRYYDELTPLQRFDIEHEENLRRAPLSWQDQVTATAQRYSLWKEENPGGSQQAYSNGVSIARSTVTEHLLVSEEIKRDPKLLEHKEFKTALNEAKRSAERRKASESVYIGRPATDIYSPIQTADFNLWAPAYDGFKFNFIHCDFPFGINAHTMAGQNSSLQVDYSDTAEDYWRLVATLSDHLDRFCAPYAHMIFWFSPNVYCETQAALDALDGFVFDRHPLIWQRGENEGIAPDPARRPRRVYDMAFFGWRGDRKIVRTKANSIVAPTERDRHPHEKPETVLRHFFEMVIDENTVVFDPTCGSGSALRAAKNLGARRYLGLELNPEYADVARRNL